MPIFENMLLWIFVTLAVVSIIILLTIVLLDLARQERQRRAVEASVMNVLSSGLTGVVTTARNNIQAISAGAPEPSTLQRLSLDYWSLVVSQPPRALVRAQLLEAIAGVTNAAQQLNGLLDARDRILSAETDQGVLQERLSSADKEYVQDAKALVGRLETLAQSIDAAH